MINKNNNIIIKYFGINDIDELIAKYNELKNEILALSLQTYNNHEENHQRQKQQINNNILRQIKNLRRNSDRNMKKAINARQESETLKLIIENPQNYQNLNLNNIVKQKNKINKISKDMLQRAHQMRLQIIELEKLLQSSYGGVKKNKIKN